MKEPQETQCLHCKQVRQLLICYISDNVAAQRLFAAVLNRTCRYHSNHRCHQKDFNPKDFITTYVYTVYPD